MHRLLLFGLELGQLLATFTGAGLTTGEFGLGFGGGLNLGRIELSHDVGDDFGLFDGQRGAGTATSRGQTGESQLSSPPLEPLDSALIPLLSHIEDDVVNDRGEEGQEDEDMQQGRSEARVVVAGSSPSRDTVLVEVLWESRNMRVSQDIFVEA